MSGADIAGIVVALAIAATNVAKSVAEFRNRMKQRLSWLESQLQMCNEWESTLEYINTKVGVNEHRIDAVGLRRIRSQLDTVKGILEFVNYNLNILINMRNENTWNQMHAQLKADEKRKEIDSGVTMINASFNIINVVLGLASNQLQSEQQVHQPPPPPSTAPSSRKLSKSSTVSTDSITPTGSTIDNSLESDIKAACKALDFQTVERLLILNDNDGLHLTTDSSGNTLLDIAIRYNSSVRRGLVETVQILIEREVKFTLQDAQYRETFRNLKIEIRSRNKRGRKASNAGSSVTMRRVSSS